MKSSILPLFAGVAVLFTGSTAMASSPDAWAEFEKQIEEKCLAAADGMFRKPQIAIDAEGSETFGFAVIFGRSKEAKGRASAICVVDKKTGVAEVGMPLGPDVIRVRKAKDANAEKKADDTAAEDEE